MYNKLLVLRVEAAVCVWINGNLRKGEIFVYPGDAYSHPNFESQRRGSCSAVWEYDDTHYFLIYSQVMFSTFCANGIIFAYLMKTNILQNYAYIGGMH